MKHSRIEPGLYGELSFGPFTKAEFLEAGGKLE